MINFEKKFWKDKNILITGINGFIGGNLAKALVNCGSNVFGIVRNSKPASFLEYESLAQKVTLIQGDLCDKDLFEQVISEEQKLLWFQLLVPYMVLQVKLLKTH